MSPNKTIIAFRCSKEFFDELDAVVARVGGNRTDFIREAIECAMARTKTAPAPAEPDSPAKCSPDSVPPNGHHA